MEADGGAEAGGTVGEGVGPDAAGMAGGVAWAWRGVVADWVLWGRVFDGVRAGGLTVAALVSPASALRARFTAAAFSCWLILGAMP